MINCGTSGPHEITVNDIMLHNMLVYYMFSLYQR